VTVGTTRPGPHESPQADMVAGKGCYEIPGAGLTYDHANPTHVNSTNLPNVCVSCHFAPRTHGDPIHTFAVNYAKCTACHEGNAQNMVEEFQTEIQVLMDSLTALLPAVLDSTTNNTPGWTPAKRQAAYAYYFVKNDGSMGVHNSRYAESVLRNAIQYLTVTPANEATVVPYAPRQG
jgi:hypothetical protein